MLSLLILQHMVVPQALFTEDVETKEETVADIGSVDVNDATRRAYRNLCRAHVRNILKRTLKIVLKKRMKKVFTRVSRMKMIRALTHP